MKGKGSTFTSLSCWTLTDLQEQRKKSENNQVVHQEWKINFSLCRGQKFSHRETDMEDIIYNAIKDKMNKGVLQYAV